AGSRPEEELAEELEERRSGANASARPARNAPTMERARQADPASTSRETSNEGPTPDAARSSLEAVRSTSPRSIEKETGITTGRRSPDLTASAPTPPRWRLAITADGTPVYVKRSRSVSAWKASRPETATPSGHPPHRDTTAPLSSTAPRSSEISA